MKIYYLLIILFFPCCTWSQLHLLNDEFNNSNTLANWQNINQVEGWGAEQLENLSINIDAPGKLFLEPYTSAWFEDYRGTLIFKEVTGNFSFTTEVDVWNRDRNGIPSSAFSLAGPMIRSPRNITNPIVDWTANGENYVFLAVGRANDQVPQLEVKTTEAGAIPYSFLEMEQVASTHNIQIRLARVGQYIICLYRFPGQSWIVHRRYHRPDMPNTLQIGLVAYTDWFKVESYTPFFQNTHVLNNALSPDPSTDPNRLFNPDIQAEFEFARFTEVIIPPFLANSNLTTVPDADLLSFLGEDSQAVSIKNIKLVEANIKLFPNPTKDRMQIEVLDGSTFDRVKIYNTLNQLVFDQKIDTDQLSIAHLDQGQYTILIYAKDEMIGIHQVTKF